MKVTFAPQDEIDAFDKEVTEILQVLGSPIAWVSDESQVGDFFTFCGEENHDALEKKKEEETLAKLTSLCGDVVTSTSYICSVARALYTRRKNQA